MLNHLLKVIWIVVSLGLGYTFSDHSTNFLLYLFPHWLQADFFLLCFPLDLHSGYKEKILKSLSIRHFQ